LLIPRVYFRPGRLPSWTALAAAEKNRLEELQSESCNALNILVMLLLFLDFLRSPLLLLHRVLSTCPVLSRFYHCPRRSSLAGFQLSPASQNGMTSLHLGVCVSGLAPQLVTSLTDGFGLAYHGVFFVSFDSTEIGL
jgi:hypothetical protein